MVKSEVFRERRFIDTFLRCVFTSRLRMTGAWLLLFKSERNIFTDVLDAAVDEHFSWDFYPHKPGRIDASILGIEFIDVQAH
jgi:hypothetical protein